MRSLLDQLKLHSTLVADTGDIEQIKRYQPQDATTNPSLLLKAAALPQYTDYLEAAKHLATVTAGSSEQQYDMAVDKLAVDIGKEILAIIPGRVSTEIDARLSFDTQATIERAKRIMRLYTTQGVDKERILIKIAATWEGIKAAEQLEKEGIHCNLTLLFGLHQAIACADAGVTLISPFVGRVLDWYNKNTDQQYTSETDPGVLSVKEIYAYYKSNNYSTIILGASFRNIGQICELAGCDLLTISPALLQVLAQTQAPLSKKLSVDDVKLMPRVALDKKSFLWRHNEDAMSTEKLAHGIRAFNQDLNKLKAILAS